MAPQRAARLSAAQNEVLVNEVEKRNDILFAKFDSVISANSKKQGWEEIARRVNSLDGPRVTPDGAKARYKTMRVNLKKMKSELVVQQRKTGGGQTTAKELKPWQEKALQLIGEEAIIGFAQDSELGLEQQDIQTAVPSSSATPQPAPLPVAAGSGLQAPPPSAGTSAPRPSVSGAARPARPHRQSRVSSSSRVYLEKLLAARNEEQSAGAKQTEAFQQIAAALTSMNKHLATISEGFQEFLQRPPCPHCSHS